MRKFLSILMIFAFTAGIANAQFTVMLVDDDNNVAEADPIVTALTNWGGTFDIFTTGVADQDTLPPVYSDIEGYDMVIWYTGNDGITTLYDVADTTGVGPGAVKFTDAAKQFVEAGGVLWIDGLDFIYDLYGGAPIDFAAGDFMYDRLGLSQYLSQSKADDGGTGVSQMDIATSNTITTVDPITWVYSTLWYADGFAIIDEATALYEMGPSGYPLEGQVTALYKNNIITSSLRIAKIDGQANIDLLISEMITAAESGTFTYGVSVNELSKLNINIYPNPATESAIINISEINNAKDISVYDITGRMVFSQAITGQNQVTINTSDYASGLYSVIIASGNETYTTKLSVVK